MNKAEDKAKQKRKFEIVIKKIFLSKQDYVFLIIITDITEIVLVDILKNNNEYKTRIFNSFSHEFRTPFNGMLPILENCLNNENCPY